MALMDFPLNTDDRAATFAIFRLEGASREKAMSWTIHDELCGFVREWQPPGEGTNIYPWWEFDVVLMKITINHVFYWQREDGDFDWAGMKEGLCRRSNIAKV